jgi:hypothetical protein
MGSILQGIQRKAYVEWAFYDFARSLQQWNAKSIASGPKSGIIEIIFLSPW